MLIVPLVVTLVLTLFHTAVANADRWRLPLSEPRIAREFDFDAGAPFARGAIRGAELVGLPGALVGAPCAGRVTFAGRLPRLGHGVSLRCGPLIATELGLERPLVRAGEVVPAGGPVGRLAANGLLHLGARHASRRFGYTDPLKLIHTTDPPPLLAPAPPGRAPRRKPPPPAAPTPATPTTNAPPLAWLGIALAGIGAGIGTTLRHHRSARTRASPVEGR